MPPEKLAETLAIIASQHKGLLNRLAIFNPEDPALLILIDQAHRAIENADYDRADQLLEKVERADREAVEKAEKLILDAQIKVKQKKLRIAEVSMERGELSLIQLNYRQAAEHFKAATELVPVNDYQRRHRYLYKYAQALYLQGTERIDNQALLESINVLREIFKNTSRDQLPQQWATTQIDLGIALSEQSIRTGGGQDGLDLLDEATNTFRQALEVFTRKKHPVDWALIQMNLGTIESYWGLQSEGKTAKNKFSNAVDFYYKALEVYTREQFPQEWADIHSNLSDVLRNQSNHSHGQAKIDLLNKAIDVCRKALQVYSRNEQPTDWARTQANLGNALGDLGMLTDGWKGLSLMDEAVSFYEQALEIYKSDIFPQKWFQTQMNMGATLGDLGNRVSGLQGINLLDKAITINRTLLKVPTLKQQPLQWASTLKNLGTDLKNKALRTPGQAGIDLLVEAKSSYEQALEVFSPEQFPQRWKLTMKEYEIVKATLDKITTSKQK